MNLPMLTTEAKLAEIKRLYFQTTKATILQDFAKALDLLKSLGSEEERERVAVHMDGLAQMRKDWGLAGGGKSKGHARKPKPKAQRATPKKR